MPNCGAGWPTRVLAPDGAAPEAVLVGGEATVLGQAEEDGGDRGMEGIAVIPSVGVATASDGDSDSETDGEDFEDDLDYDFDDDEEDC